MASRDILIRGAREHNLRDVSVDLPRGKLICFTGVSGSGKSSLAFDTIHAEGQRRYVESLSSYARQFLTQLPKPDVDRIDGLGPSISIQQKTGGNNPRSTVGTITEISDYLRVLFARVGVAYCPNCGIPVAAQTREQIVQRILELPEGESISLLAPVARGQKGEYQDLFAELSRSGYVRVRVDGEVLPLSGSIALDRRVKHDIEVVIDRLKISPTIRGRLLESVEAALKLGDGTAVVSREGREDILLSSNYACAACGLGFESPSPQLFSFNSPRGMCLRCDGLGIAHAFDPDLLVPDPALSVWEGAIAPLGAVKSIGRWRRHLFEGVAANFESDEDGPPKGTMLKGPWRDLDPRWRKVWLEGAGDRAIVHRWKQRGRVWSHAEKWNGIANDLLDRYKSAGGGPTRAMLEPYMRSMPCPECSGGRLNAIARAARVGGKSIVELSAWPIGRLAEFFDVLAGLDAEGLSAEERPIGLDPLSKTIAEELLKEIRARLRFLNDVGLDYLSLERSAPTLSGGEAQRIRLASQVGAGLVGVLYVLDEPSIGLHPRDNERLIATLRRLRDVGNTVIVVEHDEETMRAADFLVDFGPGPGVKGGEIVAAGRFDEVAASTDSLTGDYLSGRKSLEIPRERKPPTEKNLKIVGARHHNLKNIDVSIPLGLFVCVTGVSGSGKSSLVSEILRDALSAALNGAACEPGEHDRIEGLEYLDKIIDIDQSPIGRTPRSNPATYVKLFDLIRDLFSKLADAKTRGHQPGRFSFNVPGGRCEACQGNGSNRLEMDFLADVWVTCPVCEGRRFNRETLQVRFKGKNISDVLEMDVQEALDHFANVPKIANMLKTLHDVGLDYLKLGQPSPTLSGGEAQRIKLARELVRRGTGRTMYVLDEPTTGLHFEDVGRLLSVLRGFKEQGNSVVVIEHNLDVIKTADWVIDLGPEGGAGGGRIVAEGTPEQVAESAGSHTGIALARVLKTIPAKTVKKRRSTPASVGDGKAKRIAQPRELKSISIRDAREHNLKGIDLDLPRGRMTVCSGPSGSGKSSLAIDTLYAEGQRRYVESLSSYARQFLAPLPKPKVESIVGLSPSISIDQKTTSKSPRSTVGTVTEIYDYLRIVYARLGHAYCPACGTPVGSLTTDEIVEKILHLGEGTKILVAAPIDREEGENYEDLWTALRSSGFARVRVDGTTRSLEDPPKLSRRSRHRIEVVVDRATIRRAGRSRLADSIESALDLGKGIVHAVRVDDSAEESRWKVDRFALHRSCDTCGRGFDELTPHHFSFNGSIGWCPSCQGLGVQQGSDPAALVPDGSKSLRGGAVAVWPNFAETPAFGRLIEAMAATLGIDLDAPFESLEPRHRRAILHGSADLRFEIPPANGLPGFSFQYKGLFPAIEEAGRVAFAYRAKLQGMTDDAPCATCMGARLRDDAAAVRFKGLTIDQICNMPLGKTYEFFQNLKLSAAERHIAGDLIREIRDRLKFLVDVGLDYLSLGRGTPSLSGGEAQRIRLAGQLGSGLTGVLYVLDEPTIGLHPRDNHKLLKALKRLRDLGNTLVLVEHDRDVVEAADHLVDFGPRAGDEGGRVVASGSVAKVARAKESLTGRYLSGKDAIPVPADRRPTTGPRLIVQGARHHNLKNIDVAFPLRVLTAITGVSGSGKSTLIEDVLWKAAAKRLHRAKVVPGAFDKIKGLENVDKIIRVDQSPLGGTPASNPATYSGAFDLIRELFAKLPAAKTRGYTPGRFSFNIPGGRCEACEGNGRKRIEMHFLPDVWVVCDACSGARFAPETLTVKFRGKSIADVLDLKIDAALELFEGVPKIRRVLKTLADVGLGYLTLGQAAPTLSGGEAQRVKLAAELARPDTGQTLYILDEPTTGLHFDDVRKLLVVIHRLVDLGNTVVVIEHNLDVIKTADWVIDLGPEAGAEGGEIVAIGTPETVAESTKGYTGAILKKVLEAGPHAPREIYDPVASAAAEPSRSPREEFAADVKMPWEIDGRTWHTRDRVGRGGKPARWDGRILDRIVDRIQESGEFEPTDWAARAVVRIRAKNSSRDVFFEALTGNEWILTLRFRVPKGAVKLDRLKAKLNLPPFHETEPPVLSDAPRVRIEDDRLGLRTISIACHAASEILTPEFDEFLKEAIACFRRRSLSNGSSGVNGESDAPGWKTVARGDAQKILKPSSS